MAQSIVVTVPHNLGAEAAKKRIAERIELLRAAYVDKLGPVRRQLDGQQGEYAHRGAGPEHDRADRCDA